MSRVHDITGQRFGRLVVLRYLGLRHDKAYWRCVCDCGVRHDASGQALRTGQTKSCGCLRREVSREQLEKNIAASGLRRGQARCPWARRNAAW